MKILIEMYSSFGRRTVLRLQQSSDVFLFRCSSLGRGRAFKFSLPLYRGEIRRKGVISSAVTRAVSKVHTTFGRQTEDVYTIPNIITFTRILASPALGMAIVCDMKEVALGGCIVFAFSDWLDGYLAKKLNQRTVLGAFLDPMADKVMIGSLTLGLAFKGLLPLEMAAIIIGRDLALVGYSFYQRAKDKPEG